MKFDQSIFHLIEMLKIMGGEVADTTELNSFKHGMRGVLDQKFFSILNQETMEDLLKFDFSGAISYYSFNKKGQCFTMHVKSLDLKRNIDLTVYATSFMKAIINPRKKIFYQNEKKEEIINIMISKENLKQVAETTAGTFHLKFSNCKKNQ